VYQKSLSCGRGVPHRDEGGTSGLGGEGALRGEWDPGEKIGNEKEGGERGGDKNYNWICSAEPVVLGEKVNGNKIGSKRKKEVVFKDKS